MNETVQFWITHGEDGVRTFNAYALSEVSKENAEKLLHDAIEPFMGNNRERIIGRGEKGGPQVKTEKDFARGIEHHCARARFTTVPNTIGNANFEGDKDF